MYGKCMHKGSKKFCININKNVYVRVRVVYAYHKFLGEAVYNTRKKRLFVAQFVI